MEYDVIIIGAGCSGFAAAVYSGRFLLKTLVLGELLGGTITTTDTVENYPGFTKITGMDLGKKLEEHAKDYKTVEIKEEKVSKVEKHGKGFKVITEEKEYLAKTVIVATGAEHRKLNVPGEKELSNRGVHYCALCDGAVYHEKVMAVIGGSDSAAKDALVLTQWAKKVFMIYRGEKIRPEPINYERVLKEKKIEVINNSNVTRVNGVDKVLSVELDKPYKGSKELKLDAVFVAIGQIPIISFLGTIGVDTNSKGEIKIDRMAKTNIPGLFAAGDVADTGFKQAITGAAEGVLASYSAYEFIKSSHQ